MYENYSVWMIIIIPLLIYSMLYIFSIVHIILIVDYSVYRIYCVVYIIPTIEYTHVELFRLKYISDGKLFRLEYILVFIYITFNIFSIVYILR